LARSDRSETAAVKDFVAMGGGDIVAKEVYLSAKTHLIAVGGLGVLHPANILCFKLFL